jgi:hypothetical protein
MGIRYKDQCPFNNFNAIKKIAGFVQPDLIYMGA